jgi:hypothetical protein
MCFESLHPFDMPCPKCGTDDAKSTYYKANTVFAKFVGRFPHRITVTVCEGRRIGHLHRECRECGFEWGSYCRDYDPDSVMASVEKKCPE